MGALACTGLTQLSAKLLLVRHPAPPDNDGEMGAAGAVLSRRMIDDWPATLLAESMACTVSEWAPSVRRLVSSERTAAPLGHGIRAPHRHARARCSRGTPSTSKRSSFMPTLSF